MNIEQVAEQAKRDILSKQHLMTELRVLFEDGSRHVVGMFLYPGLPMDLSMLLFGEGERIAPEFASDITHIILCRVRELEKPCLQSYGYQTGDQLVIEELLKTGKTVTAREIAYEIIRNGNTLDLLLERDSNVIHALTCSFLAGFESGKSKALKREQAS